MEKTSVMLPELTEMVSQRSTWTEPGPQSYPGGSRDHKAPLTFQRTGRGPAASEETTKPRRWLLCHL